MTCTMTRSTRYTHDGTRTRRAAGSAPPRRRPRRGGLHRHASTSSSTAWLDLPVESITLASVATSSGDGSGEARRVESSRSRRTRSSCTAATLRPSSRSAGPALGPGLGGGGQVDLHIGVGQHHGADVAAFDHAPAPRRHPRPLSGHQFPAHGRVGGHGGDGGVDGDGADGVGGVLAVDEDAGAHLDVERPGQAGHALGVGQIDAPGQRRPRHGPVHGPGVEALDPEALGHGLGQGGLARAGWAVDGHHQGGPGPRRRGAGTHRAPPRRARSAAKPG